MEKFPIEDKVGTLGYIVLDDRIKKQIDELIKHNKFSKKYNIHTPNKIYLEPIDIGKTKSNIIGFKIKIK